MMDYPLSALSWGDTRASFLGPTEDGQHRVQLRGFKTTPGQIVETTEVLTDDPTEAGLRSAIWTRSRQQGHPTVLDEANHAWVDRLTRDEFDALLKATKAKRRKR